MSRRILYFLGIAALTAATGAAAMLATMRDTALDAGAFQTSTAIRAELHDGETIRTVEFYPDGITPRKSVAQNVDGSNTTYTYRTDGTLDKIVTDSAADQNGLRSRLRYSEIAPDGKTYAYDVEWAADGTKRKETRLVNNETTERSYFYADGNVRRSQVIALDSKGWKLVTEDIYREDRTLAHTLRSGQHDSFEATDYAADGVRAVFVKKLVSGQYVEFTLADDGVTKLREVVQRSDGTTITVRRPDGTIAERRQWTSTVNQGSMVVEVMDGGGKLMYDNWWVWKDEKYVLWSHREYRADGTNSRQIIFASDGKTAETELVYDGDGRMGGTSNFLRRKYRPDGTLATEEVVVKYQTQSTAEFSVEDNKRLVMDPSRLVDSEYTAPPTVVPYVPPREH
jgi:hypothetical protein